MQAVQRPERLREIRGQVDEPRLNGVWDQQRPLERRDRLGAWTQSSAGVWGG